MSTLAELTACHLLNEYLPKTIIDTIIEPYLLFQDFSIVIQQNLFREYALCERFFVDPDPLTGMWYAPFFDISELLQQLPECDHNCTFCQHRPTNTWCICEQHQTYDENELERSVTNALFSSFEQYEVVLREIWNDEHYIYLTMREVLWRFQHPSIVNSAKIVCE
jgi:hypothetical protein